MPAGCGGAISALQDGRVPSQLWCGYGMGWVVEHASGASTLVQVAKMALASTDISKVERNHKKGASRAAVSRESPNSFLPLW